VSASDVHLGWWAFAIAIAYFVGSVPFGLLIGLAKGVDIRAAGSGNIGATNAMRVLGRGPGITCFALDVCKGLAPTLSAGFALGAIDNASDEAFVGWLWMAVAAAAVLGHMFPVWLRFRGGKGVATGFGALLGVWPVMTIAALGAVVVWLVAVKATRYVGVSSSLAAASLPVLVAGAWWIGGTLGINDTKAGWIAATPFLVAGSALACLVIWRHRGNLARTLSGVEPRAGEKIPQDRSPLCEPRKNDSSQS